MPQFTKPTPNLLASQVDTLGFARGMSVPDAPPFPFASVTERPGRNLLNDAAGAEKEHPGFAGKPAAPAHLFIEGQGTDARSTNGSRGPRRL